MRFALPWKVSTQAQSQRAQAQHTRVHSLQTCIHPLLPSSHTPIYHVFRIKKQKSKIDIPPTTCDAQKSSKNGQTEVFCLGSHALHAYPRVCMAGCSNSRSRCRFTLFGSPSVSIHPKVEGPIRYSNPHVYRPERHHHASSAHISIKCHTPSSSNFA